MVDVSQNGTIFIGKGTKAACLNLDLANRHGLITGFADTSLTLQVLAERLSNAGVPVFATDVKGNLSGISQIGEAKESFVALSKEIGFDYEVERFPVIFWDLFGQQGHPLRATVTEMGPPLLSRMLDLNDVQEDALNVAFRVADENGLTLIDLKDLRSLLDAIVPAGTAVYADEDPLASIRKAAQAFGNVTEATVGTIQRQLLVLENQGASQFFGEPALILKDFMKTDGDGRGIVNTLVADRLVYDGPRVYAAFLLWMLEQLSWDLPEAADLQKPKLVLFFDEAHLLFNDAPKELTEKIEQQVRGLRSKGVGIFFITQNPVDVPEKVRNQLGYQVATQGDGEALVSFLESNGTRAAVERIKTRPPSARIGTITPEERQAVMNASPLNGKYDTTIDADSAYEMLHKRIAVRSTPPSIPASSAGGFLSTLGAFLGDLFGVRQKLQPTPVDRDPAVSERLELLARGIQIKFICGEDPRVALNGGEEMLCFAPTTLWVPRAIRTWQSASGGPSFRIAKGISMRIGVSSGSSQSRDEMRAVDEGMFVLTSRRIVFVGSKRTISFLVKRIIGLDDEGYFNWLRLNREGKQNAEAFQFDEDLQIEYQYDAGTRLVPFHVSWLIAAINQVIDHHRP